MKPYFPLLFLVFFLLFVSFCYILLYFPRFFHPGDPVNPVVCKECSAPPPCRFSKTMPLQISQSKYSMRVVLCTRPVSLFKDNAAADFFVQLSYASRAMRLPPLSLFRDYAAADFPVQIQYASRALHPPRAARSSAKVSPVCTVSQSPEMQKFCKPIC